MRIYEYKQGEPLGIGECVLAIGLFDGMHMAHRDLLDCARDLAKEQSLPFGIFTFGSEGGIKRDTSKIYDTRQKLALAERAGAEIAVVADFSALAGLSAEDFVRLTLVGDCGVRIAVAGFNFRFGKGASAGAAELCELMGASGGRAVIREEYRLGGDTVSSSRIRDLIEKGDITEAGYLLGAPYSIAGAVHHGDGRGKGLGLPTANTDIPAGRTLPAKGVYRSAVPIDGRIYNAVTNIGTCPTFGERSVHAETYIIDFTGDLYGRDLEIFLLGYLREERSFTTQEELIMQIKLDINNTKTKNGELTWQELGLSLQ